MVNSLSEQKDVGYFCCLGHNMLVTRINFVLMFYYPIM